MYTYMHVHIYKNVHTHGFVYYTHRTQILPSYSFSCREKWSAVNSDKSTECSLPKRQGVSIMQRYDLNAYIHKLYYK